MVKWMYKYTSNHFFEYIKDKKFGRKKRNQKILICVHVPGSTKSRRKTNVIFFFEQYHEYFEGMNCW